MAQALLPYYEKYLVIDTQDSIDLEGKRVREPDKLGRMLVNPLIETDRILYVPKPEYKSTGNFNYIFKKLDESSKKRKPHPRIVYVDEAFHLGRGQNFPMMLARCITTARQKKISYWTSSQRPKNIPPEILSEASKIFVFILAKEEDIKYMSTFSRKNNKELQEALNNQEMDFSFIEIDPRKGTWEKKPKLKL
jgi:hypothetical protein